MPVISTNIQSLIAQQALAVLQKGAALLGQADAAGGTHQQTNAQVLFEAVQAPANDGRGHAFGLGGSRQTAFLSHGDKGFKRFELVHADIIGFPVGCQKNRGAGALPSGFACLNKGKIMTIKVVGIVGAGTMGNGIAQACAVAGLKAVMVDIAEAAVNKGLGTIGKSLDRLVSKEKISESDKAAALSRVVGSTRYEDLQQADLVIEAATENHPIKIKIVQQLDQMLRPEVILASNTSSISITQLAAVTQRADRFIGMHFFNPVPLMKIVEVVAGTLTEPWVCDTLLALAKRLGHTGVLARDLPGFIVNHAGRGMNTEGLRVAQESVAAYADIDAIIEAKGLKQMNDSGELEKIVDEVLAANPKNVQEYKAGNAKALNGLVGPIMKASKGKANPQQVNELLKKKLG